MRVRSNSVRGEAGESLLEIMITIMIMGLAIPAVVGAVMAAVGSSSQDRKQVQAQQLLTSWSETIANATTDSSYTAGDCQAPSFYETGSYAPAIAPPAGFQVSVLSVKYWTAGTFASACASDEGVRQLLLRVTVDAGLYPSFTMDRYVVIRKPCVSC